MSSPSSYNRRALGRVWNLTDLPEEWPGYAILLRGDLDTDLVIEENEIDWRSFTRHYNGPGNVEIYSGRLIRAMKVIDVLKQDGAEFA